MLSGEASDARSCSVPLKFSTSTLPSSTAGVELADTAIPRMPTTLMADATTTKMIMPTIVAKTFFRKLFICVLIGFLLGKS